MDESFVGKVALVTGGGSGIGRASALAFAQRGASVVVGDINAEGAAATVSQISEAGGSALAVQVDVAKSADAAALVQVAVDTYGRLDFAHNNAGISGAFAPLADYPEEEWQRVLAVNLTGVMLGMKYQIAQMLRQGGGAIVNTSSLAGLSAYPLLAAYVASKHAVVGLTKTAALEYAKQGIRVNCVCPGGIRTPLADATAANLPGMTEAMIQMTPLGRLGEPVEVAGAVVWLCSSAASYMTGSALVVDGGVSAQ